LLSPEFYSTINYVLTVTKEEYMKHGHVKGTKKEKGGKRWNWYDTDEAQEILRKLDEEWAVKKRGGK
jgi:hypothetical protein